MKHAIRLATAHDSEDILHIYSYYIKNTAITFETETPASADFRHRIESIAAKYPYLIYTVNGETVGYAYASQHRERAAYGYDVDVSIYITQKYHGCGIATKLYTCLFRILAEQGFYNAYAGITVPNEKSERFHQKFGFKTVGTYHQTGYKLGRWHDVTHMEKSIRPHDAHPAWVIPVGELPENFFAEVFSTVLRQNACDNP